tara:strand:+ start:510 stop:1496 length:987 start_codon:yes stop_codon:yes gene_type:complete
MHIDYNRFNFHPKKNFLDINIILKNFSKNITKYKIENNFEILDISSLDRQKKNSILFIKDINFNNIKEDKILIITDNDLLFEDKKIKNIILTNNLSFIYNLIINFFILHDDSIDYQDEFEFKNGSYISKFSKIKNDVLIGHNCLIGRGVIIENRSIIKNNVVIKNAIIGSNVTICDNTSIGTSGFGFDFNIRGADNLNPQIGIVYIDNNSHIGSSTTIDRAKIDITYIGKNCMIDNLIHIAHNVILNDDACIAAQTGISGSAIIGKNVTIGGQVGIAGHIKIGNNVIIAAKSGVTKNIKDNSTIAGFPAIDIKEWKKKIIMEKKNGYK